MSDVKRYESMFLDPKSGEMASMRHVSEHDYDALLAERDQLREERDSHQRLCIAEMEKNRELRAELEAIRGQQPDAVSVPRELLRRLLDSNNRNTFCAGTYLQAHDELSALLSTKNAEEGE